MTGAAVINSPHAFQKIRDLFVDKYLNPQVGKLPSHNMKLAWQALAVCRAALEIHHGDKMSARDIHAKMWDKYVLWANIICDEGDCGVKINEKPDYLCERWFLTSDANHKKKYVSGEVTGKRFWKKWGTIKSAVTNSDNHVVKSTIASMPGGALPSGTNWSLFLTRLIYNLHMEKEKMKAKKADADDDDDDNDDDEAVIDEIGGSAAKKAGPNPYTDDPEEKNDSQGSGVENETNDGGENHDDNVNDEHDEPRAPATFFPATLLVVLTIGVLSEDCDTLLNHTIDQGEVEESNLIGVLSRAECRVSALTDLPPGSAVSSPVSTMSSVERLRARASYNEVYKEANILKNDLGVKRLKILEDEMNIKCDEVKVRQDEVKAGQDKVKARQDEVKLAGLAALYNNLRQDLKDARQNGDQDDVRSIKEQLQAVQRQRRDVMATSAT
mmetsp:Transcript_13729/g.19631  ORF Transcript_13729/g.19631 Transcript_13729/m.19631 type:complete len:441 (-) Transcript_13729:68-1390(-)|eukprot:CAMPEP_0184855454 /NCGR_PEP_ID=MMETSP0580-20130426/701_1 /TAXON_ID=1118495 /ORGANISM="Dactyliosolen fragilissimus" /LENGTH=440 /DNA_ID=CAMNT_0027349967 /DNA_START=289 /DNA_END=1611 /DNA_ORIENTATION=-